MTGLNRFAVKLVLCLTGFISGCASVSDGTEVKPGSVSFIGPGITTEAEVVESLGRPTWIWDNPRGIAYMWRTVAVVHNDPQIDLGVNYRAFCVRFDRLDRVADSAFLKAGEPDALKDVITKWLMTHAN